MTRIEEGKTTEKRFRRAAAAVKGPALHLPEGTRVPAGWSAVRIGAAGEEALLQWSEAGEASPLMPESGAVLRLCLALNMHQIKRVEARLGGGEPLGSLDIRYGYVFQPFELQLTAAQAQAAVREGIVLWTSADTGPVWVFDSLGGAADKAFFAPHLLLEDTATGGAAGSGRRERFLAAFLSLTSLQPFGWIEGCVLDGLYDLRPHVGARRADDALDAHLSQYLDDHGRLRYEDLFSRPADGRLTTIEATLPAGVLVKRDPGHPLIAAVIAYWASLEKEGLVMDGSIVTAEGAYTIAYPMAAAAVRLQRPALAEQAVRQLLGRRDRLARGRDFYLRSADGGARMTFRNWARAWAWYLLGMTRTWTELTDGGLAGVAGLPEVEAELRRAAAAALSWRGADRLWSCYLDDPASGTETSGSAGIAAALALGARSGALPEAMAERACETLNALTGYLSVDGVLHGVSQHNAGGDELQRGGYRVYAQMGMGLLAQLDAALAGMPGMAAAAAEAWRR
ncbi:glycoside hydrolase family 88 protein [Paenibacillus sp. IB182496]|uniref:Glycoside hydrolase family 88 protein n=1 Tax=Paenibacillus sabuli TaxID=2772509 RepID=A0A927BR02_9BACL|nr:glycoside hydrolase family 88 protein [Paenibacillus sabuli]MBD2843949.1 glycoside hydrolase family 88 protein [Paenibacillus sabuli]